MKFTNRLGLPQPIVDAVTLDTYDGPFEEGTFSVTELLHRHGRSSLAGSMVTI